MPLLLVLGYVWPEPNSSAAGWRMLSLLELYREQGWRIIFASPAERGPHRFDLATWQIEEVQIALNDSSFDQWVGQLQPDVVLFDRFMLEEQFGWRVEAACPNALRLLDSEDLHCLRAARQQAWRAGRALEAADLNSELAVRELAAIFRCDLTLTIAEYEMQLLQQHYQVPASQLLYCPFLLSEPVNAASHDLSAAAQMSHRQHFVSIGNFRHEPNWQSVLWLKQQIWPLIRAELPKAELHIYGAYPPPKATALHAPQQGFFIKGWAEDAKAVLAQARVCLAPLPFGAGLKGKFIDAMQCGTPAVTTAVGAESMMLNGQWCGLIADTAPEIAAAAIMLYQDEQLWLEKQQLGYQILQQKFAKSQLQPAIWQRLEQVRHDLPSHRQGHFLSAMLRFHQYRSTKFMGQWIEVKHQLAQVQEQFAQTQIAEGHTDESH
jgi:glycosyltransferase involved in cell wall biosynthesis